MDRRHFLTRSGLALGALIVGDAVLEEFARLTHVRKSFPSAGIGRLREEWTATYYYGDTGISVQDWRVVERIGPTYIDRAILDGRII